jgi:hypothetical protein
MPLAHHHLTFDSIQTVYDLTDDEGDKINVVWKIRPKTGHTTQRPAEYEVTVSGLRKKGKVYSLLTLGIQAVDYTTNLRVMKITPSAGKVQFLKYLDGSAHNGPITPTGREIISTDYPVADGDWVIFAKISGADQVVFEALIVDHPRCGLAIWSAGAGAAGHENDPPKNPPD